MALSNRSISNETATGLHSSRGLGRDQTTACDLRVDEQNEGEKLMESFAKFGAVAVIAATVLGVVFITKDGQYLWGLGIIIPAFFFWPITK